ncbi:hypothetical protein SARC_04942 [Sphaeroforma arctica JP610]|uniref:Uncharacterized protein n=1 Tax=Sphaeroforma arctica JP610 TaxID=667725 RepID=A0A0L0G1R8_9EUKA|nr:hypothetical protein SARC_04942 [Sphaeroforma arctica JP610]KNC82784.1 hypothetical protein SARC_04942 [Sphaeroforma arctica JP610]|eukprot:XP_014156686.1 hypothetical protein SARC_04942 [Sphaeroforma arctica JP610]
MRLWASPRVVACDACRVTCLLPDSSSYDEIQPVGVVTGEANPSAIDVTVYISNGQQASDAFTIEIHNCTTFTDNVLPQLTDETTCTPTTVGVVYYSYSESFACNPIAGGLKWQPELDTCDVSILNIRLGDLCEWTDEVHNCSANSAEKLTVGTADFTTRSAFGVHTDDTFVLIYDKLCNIHVVSCSGRSTMIDTDALASDRGNWECEYAYAHLGLCLARSETLDVLTMWTDTTVTECEASDDDYGAPTQRWLDCVPIPENSAAEVIDTPNKMPDFYITVGDDRADTPVLDNTFSISALFKECDDVAECHFRDKAVHELMTVNDWHHLGPLPNSTLPRSGAAQVLNSAGELVAVVNDNSQGDRTFAYVHRANSWQLLGNAGFTNLFSAEKYIFIARPGHEAVHQILYAAPSGDNPVWTTIWTDFGDFFYTILDIQPITDARVYFLVAHWVGDASLMVGERLLDGYNRAERVGTYTFESVHSYGDTTTASLSFDAASNLIVAFHSVTVEVEILSTPSFCAYVNMEFYATSDDCTAAPLNPAISVIAVSVNGGCVELPGVNLWTEIIVATEHTGYFEFYVDAECIDQADSYSATTNRDPYKTLFTPDGGDIQKCIMLNYDKSMLITDCCMGENSCQG